MLRLMLTLTCLLMLTLSPLLSLAAQAGEPELIPRDVIFGNPVKSSPQISPDGTRISYLAPSAEGVLNVWARSVDGGEAEQVTNDTKRGIRGYGWSEDSKAIMYIQDFGGDENWHVYQANLESKVVRDLTPFQGIRAQGMMSDRHHPNELLVGLNLRDRRVFDMYRIDLTTGAVVLDTENPGDVLAWTTDADFVIRGAVATNPMDGSTILRVRDAKGQPWRDLLHWPFGENGGPLDFTADGKALYVETSIGADTTRLVKLSLADGKELETLAQNDKVDVGAVVIHPDTHVVQAVGFNYLKNEWTVLDSSIKGDFDYLGTLQRGEFGVGSRTLDDGRWVVAYDTDDGPVTWYLYDRGKKKAEKLFVSRPELENYTLATMEPVVIKARDGLEMVGFLTVPPGKEAKNLPLVLNVHGGPWARDAWGYNGESQWFANRGYATLQLNFRASTGYGKNFLNAGNGEWGVGAMQHDLTDAVNWAIEQGIADPKKVAIYGGSYGGYATLAGLAFTPGLYCCGVDIVGPSNMQTLFASIPPYWAPLKKQLVLRVGDVEGDDEYNRKISPLFHADKIVRPLIIAQGANDPRVNIREADQMVEAMRARKMEVGYVVYPDEGHGFARPENRLDFYGRAEEFLGKHLGGRVEPWSEVEGSSAEAR